MMMRVAVNFSGFQKNPSVSESEQVRRQARRVVFKVFLPAISLTLIALVLP
jgi:hypothetical protein